MTLGRVWRTLLLVTFGGGYPVISDGQLVGVVGISGGHCTQDMAVAETALKACGFTVA